MKKVFLRNVRYIILCVNGILILGACMKPVDVIISGESDNNGKLGIEIGYQSPTNISPVLQANIGGTKSPVLAGQTVNLSDGDTITVDNANAYESINWYFDGTLLTTSQGISGSKGEILTVNTSVAPFNTLGLYPLSVAGKESGVEKYNISFSVKIEG